MTRTPWRLLALALLAAQPATAQQGTLIVLNKAAATASLVDLASGVAVATLPTGDGPHEVAVSPDGRSAVASNYGGAVPGHTLTVLDVPGGVVARTVELGGYTRPHGLAWTRDGRRLLVTTQGSHAVLVLDARRWTVERAIPTDTFGVHMVAAAPDGRYAYATSVDAGRVLKLDLRRGALVAVAPAGAGSEGIAISPDGRALWIADRLADMVSVLDPRTLAVQRTLPAAGFPIRVRFSPDGRRVVVSSAKSGLVTVFAAADPRAIEAIRLPYDSSRAMPTMLGPAFAGSPVPIGLLVSPDGARLYVATSAMGEVLEIELASGIVLRRLPAGREPDGLGWSQLRVRGAPPAGGAR